MTEFEQVVEALTAADIEYQRGRADFALQPTGAHFIHRALFLLAAPGGAVVFSGDDNTSPVCGVLTKTSDFIARGSYDDDALDFLREHIPLR